MKPRQVFIDPHTERKFAHEIKGAEDYPQMRIISVRLACSAERSAAERLVWLQIMLPGQVLALAG